MPPTNNAGENGAGSAAATGSTSQPAGSRDGGSQQPTRVDKACTRCRRKKMSCRMSTEDPSKCQRCLRSNEDCVFPETTERPRKRRLLNSRVGQLEQNLEGIISLLATAQAAAGGPPPTFVTNNKKTPAASSVGTSRVAASKNVELPAESPVQPKFNENGRPDPIDKGLITVEAAEIMFEKYREMSTNYPFVLLPEKMSLTDLRDRSPMVLRAILCATSFSDALDQDPFEREYLHSISMHAMVEGHRSLDALQSLMIFLSWCHWHVKPERQHLYRLASLAVGICYDLGINRKPQKTEAQLVGIEVSWMKSTGLEASSQDFWGPEARRVLVGLYCLTATWAIVRRKTPLMAYNDYFNACAESLAAGEHSESDRVIIHRLEVVRFFTQAADTLGYSEPYTSHPMSDDRLEVFTGSLLHRLEMWKNQMSNSGSEAKTKTLFEYHCMQAYTREVAAYFPARVASLSMTRTRMLVDCLTHIKAALDIMMSYPAASLREWTTTQWCALLYVIILANKVSTCHGSSSWNISVARNVMRLEQYLSQLSQMVEEANRACATGQRPIYWFQHLIGRWDVMKASYMQVLEKFESSEASSRGATPQHASSPASQSTPGQTHHYAGSSASPRLPLPITEKMEELSRPGSHPTSYDRTPRMPVPAYNNYYMNQLPPPNGMANEQGVLQHRPDQQQQPHPQSQPPPQQQVSPYNMQQRLPIGTSSQQTPMAAPMHYPQQGMMQPQWLPPTSMAGSMPGDYMAWEIDNSFMGAL